MTRKAGLNSNTLKLLAVVAMICQHVTIFFIPTTNPWYDPLFCFGMITAPIMCFFIAEGVLSHPQPQKVPGAAAAVQRPAGPQEQVVPVGVLPDLSHPLYGAVCH